MLGLGVEEGGGNSQGSGNFYFAFQQTNIQKTTPNLRFLPF